MPQLVWGAQGTKHYEYGIDRGVLFVHSVDDTYETGVPWDGLISMNEEPTGGEPRPFYIDGVKYLNLPTKEEFVGTLTAFKTPPEFGACDGDVEIRNGLSVTRQRRKAFGMSYRTRVGNDSAGELYGYRIHMLWMILAAPSAKNRRTKADENELIPFEWSLTTKPPEATEYFRSSHMYVDSKIAPAAKLKTLEGYLYGTTSTASRLPTQAELLALFE